MLPPFQLLLDRHGDEAYRLCAGMVGAQDAADCYQEAVLSALRAYPSLRDAANLRGWLLTIARRKAVDSLRARRRAAPSYAEVPDVMPATDASGISHDAPDGIWEVVRGLPPKQSAAMVHRFVEDRPYRDIAALLDCSEEAARRSVHEGIVKLRQVYGHE